MRDICKYFNVDEDEITKFLESIDSDDDYEIDKCINRFIDEHPPITAIDKMLFFHLSRRLDTCQSNGALNLFDLLTMESPLSNFFKKYGITFVFSNEHIEVKQNGKIVFIDSMKDTNVNITNLKGRLGYADCSIDYCVNGYAIRIYEDNTYYRWLGKCPEFVSLLSKGLNRKEIALDYQKESNYYLYVYCLPINMVIIDNKEDQTVDDKVRYLLVEFLYNLQYKLKNGERSLKNPIKNLYLRLDEYQNIDEKYMVDHILLK